MRLKENFKLTVSLIGVLFIAIFLPLLTPWYFRQQSATSQSIIIFTYASMLIMAIVIVTYLKKISTYIFPILMIYFCYIISTYMNDGDFSTAVVNSLLVLLICLLVNVVVEYAPMQVKILKVIKYITLCYWIVNMILVFIFPSGLPGLSGAGAANMNWLYGNVNTGLKYIFPGMLCSVLLDCKKGKVSIGTIVFFLGNIYIYVFIYHTTTNLIGCLFIIAWIVFRRFINNNLIKSLLIIYGAVLFLEVAIVFLSNTNLITLITSFFGKSSDFSGRVILWQRTIAEIVKNPIWGNGYVSSEELYFIIGNSSGSHNYYLDFVYQHGVIGGILMLLVILSPLFITIKSKKNVSTSAYIALGFSCSYLVMFLMEPFNGWERYYVPIFYATTLLTLRSQTCSDVMRTSQE